MLRLQQLLSARNVGLLCSTVPTFNVVLWCVNRETCCNVLEPVIHTRTLD
jgi:hypothetical protein